VLTFEGWKFPDGEMHIPHWMRAVNHRVEGRLTYQHHKYQAALALCTQRRVAVDVGAHVGLWSYYMAQDFGVLHAFEPSAAHCACWRRNVPPSATARLHELALGEAPRRVGLTVDVTSSGNTRIALKGPATIEMRTLDSIGLDDVDLLKVDCEGYDYFVIAGGVQTIMRSRPVIVVEQKPPHAERYGRRTEDARDLLLSLGAHVVENLGGDFIMAFKEAA